MIRSSTIRRARQPIENKVEKPSVPVIQAPIQQDNANISEVVSSAILEICKSNNENAKIMRDAIEKTLVKQHIESPKKWTFEVIPDDDIHSSRYGMIKKIIALAEE